MNAEKEMLIVDSRNGIYGPQLFAKGMSGELKEGFTRHGFNDDDVTVLLDGPDHEWYWEAWINVVNNFELRYGSDVWDIVENDGDIWLVHVDSLENWSE